MRAPQNEIDRRRTLLLYPTRTPEKPLLQKSCFYTEAPYILQAPSKPEKANRHATSDWMEIEKQRGISVTSSVMAFDYDGYRINILDTPAIRIFQRIPTEPLWRRTAQSCS